MEQLDPPKNLVIQFNKRSGNLKLAWEPPDSVENVKEYAVVYYRAEISSDKKVPTRTVMDILQLTKNNTAFVNFSDIAKCFNEDPGKFISELCKGRSFLFGVLSFPKSGQIAPSDPVTERYTLTKEDVLGIVRPS